MSILDAVENIPETKKKRKSTKRAKKSTPVKRESFNQQTQDFFKALDWVDLDSKETIHEYARQAYDLKCELYSILHEGWVDAGGCDKCGGYGQVLGWWTLDGSAYDEWKTCDMCNGRGGSHNPDRPKYTYSPVKIPSNSKGFKQAQETLLPPSNTLTEVNRLQEIADHKSLYRHARILSIQPIGDRKVTVYKGRKVPVGTYDCIRTRVIRGFGYYAGLEVRCLINCNGKEVWIAGRNCFNAEYKQCLELSLLEAEARWNYKNEYVYAFNPDYEDIRPESINER